MKNTFRLATLILHGGSTERAEERQAGRNWMKHVWNQTPVKSGGLFFLFHSSFFIRGERVFSPSRNE
jgi:hypothetical protein